MNESSSDSFFFIYPRSNTETGGTKEQSKTGEFVACSFFLLFWAGTPSHLHVNEDNLLCPPCFRPEPWKRPTVEHNEGPGD